MKKFTILIMMSLATWAVSAQDLSNQGFIKVTGEAGITLPADFATIRVAVQAESTSASEAMKEVQKKMAKIINYLEQQASVESVKTEYVQLNTGGSPRQETVFNAFQSLSFKLSDLSEYDLVLSSLMDLGVNNISDVSFHSAREGQLETELLTQAVLDARQKATILAAGLGQSIGEAVYISDHVDRGGLPQPMFESKSAFGPGPSVAPGDLQFSRIVIVQFKLN